MLTDSQIRDARRWRDLRITPFEDRQLQPASYDVRLHPTLLVLKPGGPIDPKTDSTGEWVTVHLDERGFLLKWGHFALGSTAEHVHLGTHLMGQLEGKSSLGRLGLMVHSTAGYLDPGFEGQVTLELSCVHTRGVVLYPGMPVGQIAFDSAQAVERPYQGKYVGQEGPTASRNHENWTGTSWR